ncbi:hypothetical protein C8Q78DRAFT_539361 [Trametes maxima]|nr:hypothetical protein C8Q78DRAFT_539361 [Trametes maxima]
MTQVSTSNSPPPNSGYQDMHARQPEERYRGPSRELSYVDAGWPVCPPPRPDEDLLPLPLATELPHEPHNIDSESLSDPALNVRTTPFTPNSAGRTTSPPCPVTEGPALSNQVSSVGHPQQFESPKRLLIPSNNRTTIPAPSARPFASSSVLDRGSGYGGPQASPSDHAQHSFREQARRTSPTVAGVKVQLGSPLMDNIAAQQRLEGAVRYEVNVDPALRALTVDRIFMASAFGGHIQHFSTRVEGRSFLYPTLAMDPELPLEFGMPGLLCRASRSREWGDGPQRLFVGLRSGHFRYVGEYELTPSTPLSVKEYRALASKVKVKWAEAIRRKKKHKDVRVRILMRRQNGREASDLELAAAVADKKRAYDDLRADDIIYDYEAGLETMFIWRMQCIGFDLKFLRRVAQARATYVSKPRAKRIKPGEPMANTLPVARAHAPSPEP